MTGRLSGERGATLLEVLVAMTLLAVALLGLAASFPLSLFAVIDGGWQTVATGLALEIIEQARRTPYANLETALEPLDGAISGYPAFTRQVDVDLYDPGGSSPCSNCTKVTVKVSFTGQQGLVDTTVSTVIASP